MDVGAPFVAWHGKILSDAAVGLPSMFQQYVEATPIGILVVDHDGTITFVNRSLCTCFGYESQELLGQPIEILVPDAIKPDHVQLRDAYIDNPLQRLMVGREVRGRRKDGSEIDVAIGLNPMVSDFTVHVACTVMDLSPLKQAETTLERFFDLSLDLFCIASTDGHFLRINPNFSRLLGYSDQELQSRPFISFVHPEDVAATRTAVATLDAGQPVVRFRNRYAHLQGGYRWIEWSARAIPEDGAIFAVGRDVTEEVAFAKELQAREQRERAILDNTPAVVYLKDTQGRYLYANQRFHELFAVNQTSIIGRNDYEIFPAALANKFVENDRQVLVTQNKVTTQETAPHPDGLHTYVSVKFPLLDAEGTVAAMAGISTDITEHIQAQELRNQLQLATAFQQKLFPTQAPSVAGLDLSGAAVPVTHLCGDYFDFLVTGPGRVVLAVGDVSGHGLGPALAMVQVRSILRGLLHDPGSTELPEVLENLNQLLVQDLPDGTFVSLFLAEIDSHQGMLQYTGAGHDAWLCRAGEGITRLDSNGPVLGLLDSVRFDDVPPVALREGDVLLFCTDGLTEAMNPQRDLFGRQRLVDCLAQHQSKSSHEIIQGLFAEVIEFASGRTITDDMTAVVARIVPTK